MFSADNNNVVCGTNLKKIGVISTKATNRTQSIDLFKTLDIVEEKLSFSKVCLSHKLFTGTVLLLFATDPFAI